MAREVDHVFIVRQEGEGKSTTGAFVLQMTETGNTTPSKAEGLEREGGRASGTPKQKGSPRVRGKDARGTPRREREETGNKLEGLREQHKELVDAIEKLGEGCRQREEGRWHEYSRGLQRKIDKLERELENERNRNVEKEAQLPLYERNKELEKRLERAHSNAEELEKFARKMQAERDSLRAQRDAMSSERQSMVQELRSLRSENSRLKTELEGSIAPAQRRSSSTLPSTIRPKSAKPRPSSSSSAATAPRRPASAAQATGMSRFASSS